MDCATMSSDVIGDFQEPYCAVLVDGDDMAALPITGNFAESDPRSRLLGFAAKPKSSFSSPKIEPRSLAVGVFLVFAFSKLSNRTQPLKRWVKNGSAVPCSTLISINPDL